MRRLVLTLLIVTYTGLNLVSFAWSQCQTELLASNGSPNDNFGYAVDISGNWAVVGAKLDDDRGSGAGAAYVYELVNSNWVYRQKLFGSDTVAGDSFGSAVAIDGTKLVVGAQWGWNAQGLQSGAAYVFNYNGTSWIQEQKLEQTTDYVTRDHFGASVGISGGVIAVGAWKDNDRGDFSGSVSVFRYNGSTWALDQKLLASDGIGSDYFGFSLGISGNMVVAGAYGDDDLGTTSGSAYVFRYVPTRSAGDRWVQERKLLASDGVALDSFGYAVAAADNVVVVGAYGDDDRGPSFGSAFIFRYNGSNWSEEAKLYGSDSATGDLYGGAVAITNSPAGDIAVIGASKSPGGLNVGAAYVYRKIGTNWEQDRKLSALSSAQDKHFGRSVAVADERVIAGMSAYTGSPNIFFLPCLACVTDSDCNDSNSCSHDICGGGFCSHPNEPNGFICDDWNPMTPYDRCSNGMCVGQMQLSPTISSSSPPNGYIDPLEDRDATTGTLYGERHVSITFSAPVTSSGGSALGAGNFTLGFTRNGAAATDLQTGQVPIVSSVTGSGAGPYTLHLSSRIPLGAWTKITAVNVVDAASGTPISATANSIVLGFLPMDITQDGRVLGDDISRWLAIRNGGFALPAGLTQLMLLDQKRNGIVAGEDITRGIQLINGTPGTTFRAWSGFDMGIKP